MNSIIKATSFVFSLFLYSTIAGQSSKYATPSKIVPASPDVAAFQRFGDIPVSPYTGVPNISIPVYTINMGDIEVPVSISYHASGIKVNDEASRVGLGWALNAGGVITRTVLNLDDFASRVEGYHFTTSTPNAPDGPKVDLGTSFNIQGDNAGCTVVVSGAQLGSYLTQRYDFEPDLYNFNFLGYSGTFIMKRNKDVVLLKSEKLQITYLANGTWQIKTPDGSTYLFEQTEDYLDYFSDYNTGAPSINAWHLTKITSPKGRVVDFVYIKLADRLRVPGSYFQTTDAAEYLSDNMKICGSLETLVMYSYNIPNKDYSKVYLDRINFDNGTVSFAYSARDDIEGELKLDSMQLSQPGGAMLKRWVFGYDYFVGTADGSRTNVGTPVTRSKRLKLKNFTMKASTGDPVNPYNFIYNEPVNAPQKTSFGADYWGYWNGNYNRINFTPDMLNNNSGNIAAKILGTMGDNRAVNPDFNQLFILKEIQYPTGGKTVFEFETHDFDIKKSLVNDHSFYKDNMPAAIQKSISKMYDGRVHTEQPQVNQIANYILDLTDLVVDKNAPYPTAPVNLTAFFRYDGSVVDPCMLSGVMAKLCREDGTELASADIAFFIGQTSMPMTTCIKNAGGIYIGAEFKNLYNLPQGKYVWKLTVSGSINYIVDVKLRIDYPGLKEAQDIINNGVTLTGADFGGGLRVKRVLQYDNISTVPVNIKRYQYYSTDGQGKNHSYGRRMAQPVYGYFEKKYYSNPCTPLPGTTDFHTWTRALQSESIIPLESSVSGTSVGYDTVVVYEGENGENGKAVYQFENEPHIILDYSVRDFITTTQTIIPRKPPSFPVIQNYGNGNVLSETDYKNINGHFIKVKQILNTYSEFYPANNIASYGIERRQLSGVIPNPACQFEAFVYPLMTKSRKLLSSTTTRIYDQKDISQFTEQTINYTYDHNTHLQLRVTDQLNSKGDQISTTVTYPLDYADANSDNAILQMKGSAFMHSSPVTQFTTIRKAGSTTSLLVDGTIRKYQYVNGLVTAKEVATADVAAPVAIPAYQPSLDQYPVGFTPKLKFNSYDSKGNILELQKVNDNPVSYIWDNIMSYPIAEVKGAYSGQMAYTSFEADGNGNWSIPSSIRIQAGITGTKSYNLSNGAITRSVGLTVNNTYTVSYWSQAGSCSINGTTAIKQGKSTGGWTFFEHTITNTSAITIQGNVTIDELRLYPKGAEMTTYTFTPLIGVTSSCDQGNRVTYYAYDGFGRLLFIKDQDGNIVKTMKYRYQGN